MVERSVPTSNLPKPLQCFNVYFLTINFSPVQVQSSWAIQNMLPAMMMMLLLLPWPVWVIKPTRYRTRRPATLYPWFTTIFLLPLFSRPEVCGVESTPKGRVEKPTEKVYYFHKFTFISTFMWIYWILFCCCCCCPVDLFVHRCAGSTAALAKLQPPRRDPSGRRWWW